MKVLVVLGSVRIGRNGEKVFDWLRQKLPSEKYEFIDLKEYNLPMFDNEKSPKQKPEYSGNAKKWQDKVAGADGFIFVTPEYNHGYSPALKNAIDYLWYEWNNKPVSFVSYGGQSGGSRAVEQLRQVVIELQMHPLRNEVNIPFIWNYESSTAIETMEKNGKMLEATINQLEEKLK